MQKIQNVTLMVSEKVNATCYVSLMTLGFASSNQPKR
jgi:hypothetical protein